MSKYYTAQELAEKAGVTTSTVYAWKRKGKIQEEHPNGSKTMMFSQEQLDHILDGTTSRNSSRELDESLTCHHCGKKITHSKDLVIKPTRISKSNGIKYMERYYHFECMKEYNEELNVELEEQQENSWWDKAYMLAKDWLDLEPGQNLSRYFVLRLKGLRIGKYMPTNDNTHITKRGYSFEVIYRTMQLCTPNVRKAMAEKPFSDDNHRTNYIMRIIESKINLVNSRIKESTKAEQRLKEDKQDQVERRAEYKRKSSKGNNSKLSKIVSEAVSERDSHDELDDLFD
ncbi:hypothetical protein B8A44_09485 [Dolosigranulum pigrum]|uniref:HTH merR-type domain-containing protein n=1 Tax=Dolosigranulum pigrum TaxID=29394 RepID=A0A328KHS9_9LACT|nr:MerR family transcriptional regulator [Dolosigranulum pigrum]RAN61384.1 hypothetical protein B8A44_09485 [Dolosigranulum pigrum]